MEDRTSRVPAFSEDAFRRLYEETLPEALAVAAAVCGSDEDAKEACQDAYLALYRYWSGGRLAEPPRRLLFRVVQRSAVDALRSRLRRERQPGHGEPATTPGTVAGPLGRAFRRLQPGDAALLALRALVGMSYDELAAIECTSVSAVRSRLFRARRELARRYEEEGGEW